jgi:hypothetical protein
MKSRAPLHGYNTNYRREGRVYHVQTEDLGLPAAAVVTQVFVGGTILSVRRTPYGEHLLVEGAEEGIRELMRRQHKALLVALRDGTLEGAPERAPTTELSDADVDIIDDGSDLRDTVRMDRPEGLTEQLLQTAKAVAKDLTARAKEQEPKKTIPLFSGRQEPPATAATAAEAAVGPEPDGPPTDAKARSTPAVSRPTGGEWSIPAAAVAPEPMPAAPQPPPAVAASTPTDATPASPRPVSSPGPRSAKLSPTPPPLSTRRRALRVDSGRYAVVDRPPGRGQGPRLFSEVSQKKRGLAEDQIGERSLDDVILAYLAEELQEE